MTPVEETRRQITEFGRMLFDRHLTEAAGVIAPWHGPFCMAKHLHDAALAYNKTQPS